jgi:hypothetical protein
VALVRRLHKRGATITVEAHGEVLFLPGTELSRWKNSFSHNIRLAAAAEAPVNKRPRWGHYGKPLKSTITAATTTRITQGGGFFYIAVGSTAPHAYYVDQGTGIYAGGGPYKAKILPPWSRGDSSLYEHTWIPGNPNNPNGRVRSVFIKGQKGQFFFDKGLKRAFQKMRLPSVTVPVESLSGALSSFPTGLDNFSGNTPSNGAFIASLVQWRAWRDAAYNRGESLNRSRYDPHAALASAQSQRAAAARARREAAARAAALSISNLKASREAAKRRAEEQKRKLLEEKKRRDKGKKLREEKAKAQREAQALRAGNEKMRRQATEFYKLIRKAHPEATFGKHKLPDGVIIYRVTYVLNGETIRQQWAYGYAT